MLAMLWVAMLGGLLIMMGQQGTPLCRRNLSNRQLAEIGNLGPRLMQ